MHKAAKRRFVLKPPVIREHPLQTQLAGVMCIEIGPPAKVSRFGVVWWCQDVVDYGPDVAATRIARGLVAGVPDMFVLYRGIVHLPEIKADDGVLSDFQTALMSAVIAGGGHTGVVRNSNELLDHLDVWNIPRERRIMP